MPNFIFAYHGGGMPETEEEQATVMAAWEAWYGSLGEAITHGGAPVGEAKTVASDGSVSAGGGANPVSGYTLVAADSIDDAVTMAKGCPILDGGGSVEVGHAMDM